ncbi:3313_t:CDS:2 [Funneliformis mosseae]|uniref:3313_t:CDS:1 n=1 Tax=Funneliformis mosseae TaxID=27381 RepID=A0A9N9DV23_FUNMO|nr:3313_t:CDS:2 [Funneliformis mosseae]
MFFKSKHTLPISGTPRPTPKGILSWLIIRIIVISFVTFSAIFSFTHIFWSSYFGRPRILHPITRTYDTKLISPLSEFNNSNRFSKMHSKTSKLFTDGLYPYYYHAEHTPELDDVTIATFVSQQGFDDLIRLAEVWQGPISAILHVPTKTLDDTDPSIVNILATYNDLYKRNAFLKQHVDIHLITGPVSNNVSILPRPTNFHLNVARLFARSEFVLFLDQDTWPTQRARKILRKHKSLLLQNDILVLPSFTFTELSISNDFPRSFEELTKLVKRNYMGLIDDGWSLNKGPTSYENWLKKSIYNISEYDIHYQPNFVVKRGSVIPWCTERFDNFEHSKAACLFQMYISGSKLWVIPEAFSIKYHYNRHSYLLKAVESKWEKTIKDRMYAKFLREACIHHARILDSLGDWSTPKANHVKQQCDRIITNWGLGIIDGLRLDGVEIV